MTTDSLTIPLGVFIALCIIIPPLIIFLIIIVILLRLRLKNSSQHWQSHESDTFPLRPLSTVSTKSSVVQPGFCPCIAVIGRRQAIVSFMAARGCGEGTSHSTAYGRYLIKYNPPYSDKAVNGVVILHDVSEDDKLVWMKSGKLVVIEGTDAVRQKWWPKNCTLSLTTPFDTLLQVIARNHVI